MANLESKKIIINDLQNKGINFDKEACQLSGLELSLLEESAKTVNYRKPKGGYYGIGRSFFEHLKKY